MPDRDAAYAAGGIHKWLIVGTSQKCGPTPMQRAAFRPRRELEERKEAGGKRVDTHYSAAALAFSSGNVKISPCIDKRRRGAHAFRMRWQILLISVLMACNVDEPAAVGEGVQVAVDRDAYTAGDTVNVSIHNGLDSLLTTYNHQSYCWIARLERAVSQGWELTGPCYSMQPTEEQSLAPGESWSLRLPVTSHKDAYPAVIESGRYRWEFVYAVGPGFSFAQARQAFSSAFVVR